MALTVTVKNRDSSGNKRTIIADIDFDSSYAYGGESLTPATLGLSRIDCMRFENTKGGLFEYDYTNSKLKVFRQAPPIILDEVHTAVSHQVTLDYPAAYIINVAVAGTNQKIVKTGTAYGDLSANTCCLTTAMAAGVRTTITTAGETDTIYVSYVTQAWKEIWDNLVQEEEITLATGNNTLANTPLLFQSAYQTSATATVLTPVDQDATPSAGEVGIVFGSATNNVKANAAQNGKNAVFTYVKKPSSGFLANRAFSNVTMAESGIGVNTIALYPLLLWGYCGYAPVNGATTYTLIELTGTPGTGEANFTKTTSVLQFGDDGAQGTAAGLWGFPHEIPGLVPLEVRNGTNLSDLTGIRIFAVGV
jgi:hypothetical protein